MAVESMALPRFMVLQSKDKNDSLVSVQDDKASIGYLRLMDTQSINPFAKFEVVSSSREGHVHILCSQTNKYWVRIKDASSNDYWITATADQPEEDRTKETCTLFKPVAADNTNTTVRFMHSQSRCFLSTSIWKGNRYVSANDRSFDPNNNDVFRVIDWSPLLILPRYVAFKGENNHYLRLQPTDNEQFVRFTTIDIGDPAATFEIFATYEGIIRVKPNSSDRFWRREDHPRNWIYADFNDSNPNTRHKREDTLFRPTKVDDTIISLLNLGNNQFCKYLDHGGKHGLYAFSPSIDKSTRLIVEEPILSRRIDNVRYNLNNSRVYDERVVTLDTNAATNYTQQPATFDVRLSYTNTKSSAWNTLVSLKLPTKATINFEVPVIIGGWIQLSGEVQQVTEWGETKAPISTVVNTSHQVAVPPISKVTVSLVATNGKCDVPFTFMQRDTFYDGRVVTTEMYGIYTGSNYYNVGYQAKVEQL